MTKAGKTWGFFQFAWIKDNSTSSSATIKAKEGKCVSMTNLYIDLARSFGIPSRDLNGFAINKSSEGHHAWAASYLHPYGWVEIDPTWGQFEDFEYNRHAYKFSYDAERIPDLGIIEGDSANPEMFEKVTKFVRELKVDMQTQLSCFDRHFNTPKAKDIKRKSEFLESLV